jgi:hypothetical protein
MMGKGASQGCWHYLHEKDIGYHRQTNANKTRALTL